MNKGIRIFVLDGDPLVRPYTQLICDEARKAVKRVLRFISPDAVDIVLTHQPQDTGRGVSHGRARGNHHAYISLNVQKPHFVEKLPGELTRTIAHELYHLARVQNIGYSDSLLECMIEEGLARHFELEVIGEKPKRSDMPIGKTELLLLKKKARRDCMADVDYSDWYSGSKKRGIPPGAMHILGYDIIRRFFAAHPGLTPSQLVDKDIYKMDDILGK